MRVPRIASSAGSSVSASTSVPSTTAMPPIAIERRNICGNTNRPSRLAATVTPENATARPVVDMASTTSALDAERVRQLLAVAVHEEQRVVDREAEPEQRDDVRRRRATRR